VLEGYRVLRSMSELGEFTVDDLAAASGVKPATVRTVLARESSLTERAGTVATGSRGGQPVLYRLAPDARERIAGRLGWLESSTPPMPAEAALPVALLASEQLLLAPLPPEGDAADRHLAIAWLGFDEGRAAASAPAPHPALERHLASTELLLGLAEQERDPSSFAHEDAFVEKIAAAAAVLAADDDLRRRVADRFAAASLPAAIRDACTRAFGVTERNKSVSVTLLPLEGAAALAATHNPPDVLFELQVNDEAVQPRVPCNLVALAEWFALVWDRLFHEERLPGDRKDLLASEIVPKLDDPADQAWYYHHSLRQSRAGTELRDLRVRRSGGLVELSLAPALSDTAPAFRSARLHPQDVAHPIHRALLRMLQARSGEDGAGEALAQLEKVRTSAWRRQERVAWLAGLGTSTDKVKSRWEEVTASVQAVAAKLVPSAERARAVAATIVPEDDELVVRGSCQAALLFGSVSPTVSHEDVGRLAEVLIDAYDPAAREARVSALVRDEPIDPYRPAYEQGHWLASALHDELGTPEDSEWIDLEPLTEELGITVRRLSLGDGELRGVSIASDEHRPTIVVNDSSRYNVRAGDRLTVAHELCHLLYDRTYGASLAIASGPWAPRDVERRANAFAVMFLMPRPMVARAWDATDGEANRVERVRATAELLHVTPIAALEHMRNLAILTVEERDDLIRYL
jgi:Zn-dependent peptidase ImmA (M78 family)/DNA-binding transcriptional ArsR family regulator